MVSKKRTNCIVGNRRTFMRNPKRLISVLIVLCLLSLATSVFAQGQKDQKVTGEEPIRIIFVTPMTAHPVWLGAKYGMDAAVEEFGFDGTWIGADDHSLGKTMEALETAIAEKPDGIICDPFAPSAFTAILQRAKDAGIVVATVCVDAEDTSQRVSFIGTDKIACGMEEAAALHQKVGDDLRIGVMMSNLDAQDQILQVDGLKKYLKDQNLTDAKIVAIQDNDADSVRTIEVLTAMLIAHPEINAIFGTEGAGPASYGTVLKELNLTKEVTAIGMDDVETNLAPVREGTIYGVMAQDFYKMGYLASKNIIEYMKGNEVPDIVDSGVTLVTLENIDTYKNQ